MRPNRGLATLVTVCAAVVATTLTVAPARAAGSGCDTWKQAVNGNWSDATKWSAGVPTSGTDACITAAGSYTVSVTDDESAGTVTVGTGSASDQQPTLSLSSVAGTSQAELYVDGDITNSLATVTLGSTGRASGGTTYYDVLNWGGSFANSGTLSTTAGPDKALRYLEGDLVNTGTVSLGAPTTYDGSGATLEDDGTFTIASGVAFQQSNAEMIAAGPISNGGSYVVQGGTFRLTTGSVSGALVELEDATLADAGSGAATFQADNDVTLLGNVAAGQTLTVAAISGNDSGYLVAPASFTNAGTITLTSVGSSHGDAEYTEIDIHGTLTNTGTLNLAPGVVDDGRYVYGNVTNSGTIDVTTAQGFFQAFGSAGGTLTNHKSLKVEAGGALLLYGVNTVNDPGAASMNIAGSLTAQGGTFEQVGGKITGPNPLTLTDGSTLALEGAGAGKFTFTDGGTLVGNVAAQQTVTIAGITNDHGTTVSEPGDFTNAGTIALVNQGAASGGAEYAELSWSGQLTNSGTITASGAGDRYLTGNRLSNTGTVTVAATITASTGREIFTNAGTLSVSPGKALMINSDGRYVQTSAGTLSIGVSGTRAGSVQPSRSATLAGTLAFTGTPTSGRAYTVLGPTAYTIRGTFTTVTPSSYTVTYPSGTSVKATAA